MQKDNQLQISTLTLKLIAMTTMLIDHFGIAILGRLGDVDFFDFSTRLSALYNICRFIGRLAFPIYIFLLVEGLNHTKSRVRYLGRLLLLAAISEIPFDLALGDKLFDLKYNNVLITLFLGGAAITIGEELMLLYQKGRIRNQLMLRLYLLLIYMAAIGLGFLIRCDYRGIGICAILVMYFCRSFAPDMSYIFGIFILMASSFLELIALVTYPFVHFYNGKKGYSSKLLTMFFYSFYPLHLLVLALIAWFLHI